MSTEQTTREDRESQTRELVWEAPNKLKTPKPPEGFKYRWVRRELLGMDHDQNVLSRLRQHYQPVMLSEIPEYFDQYASLDQGKYEGVVSVGDLILMKVPLSVVKQREAHYAAQTEKMQKAVDHELTREDAKSQAGMHVTNESKSTTTKGRPSFEK